MAKQKDFDKYCLQLANFWGVGKKDKNNGILITIATPMRKVRINTGLGIEKLVTDQEAKIIIESIIVPRFKKGLYFQGTMDGIRTLMRELE